MAQVSRTRVKVGYRDDANVLWWLYTISGIASQAKLGEVALTGGELQLPGSVVPRYTTVRNAANKISRKVTVYSPGAPIQTVNTSINLNETQAGVLDTMTFLSTGKFQGERQARANSRRKLPQ